jgi:hypothetical protein
MYCEIKEDILLPKSDTTTIKNIESHSPIYIFFRTKWRDTFAEVNRKNSIITTNSIFNIGRRLPLRIVILEVMKLQDKKRKEKAHENKKGENYNSYADSIVKNMAFTPFTKVHYKMAKPLNGCMIFYFKKDVDSISVDNHVIKTKEVADYLNNFNFTINPKILLFFDKNMSFEEYL